MKLMRYTKSAAVGHARYSVVLALVCFSSLATSAPEGGQIVGGSGSISQSGSLTEINQNSQRMAIDWQRFDVAADERVQFIQPSSDAVALNRILDSKASTILGRVDANGMLFLVNPRGIIFGKGAVINAAGLVASDLGIDPEEFMKGNYQFANDELILSSGVINQGEIEAAVGGSVSLLGTVINNEGQIAAPQGTIQLVAADEVVISFEPEGDIGLVVNKRLLHNETGAEDAVNNSGALIAEGGQVLMAGHVTSDLYTQAVNNEGIIEATSLEMGQGYIELMAVGGDVVNSGSLNASGQGSLEGGEVRITADNITNSGEIDVSGVNGGAVYQRAQQVLKQSEQSVIDARGTAGVGGTVELYGERVGVLDESRIDASGENGGGTILIGGDYQGSGEYNAQLTAIGQDVLISADAITEGDGGKVIVWSDNNTVFQGEIFARGGSHSGDGGFVEVSGKEQLQFIGNVDTSAANGSMGTLLLDPAIINILDGGVGGTNDADVLDGLISQGDGGGVTYFITEDTLESLTSNITLQARDGIIIDNLTDNELCFYCVSGSGTVTFEVAGSANPAYFTMDSGDTINVSNGNLVIDINTTDGDAVTVTTGNLLASGNIDVFAIGDGGSGGFGGTSGDVSITTADVTSTGGSIRLLASADADAGFSSFITTGDAIISTGVLSVGGSGNIDVDAQSTMNAVFTFGTSAGNSSITSTGANIGGAGTIDFAAQSNGSGLAGNGGTNIYLSGDYLAGSGANNGFFRASANAIRLNGNTTIDMVNDGAVTPIVFTTNSVIGNGNALTLDVDQGAFAMTWSEFSNISALTLRQSNNIYIDAAGAGAGDETISQGNLDQIDNFTNVLTVVAGGNIVSGTPFYNNFTDVTLTAGGNYTTSGAANTTGANLVVNAGGAITLDHALTSGAGNVTLSAVADINANSSISSGGGNVGLTSSTGDILMGTSATISAGSGQVSMLADGDIALTGITTTNATGSAVSIQSTTGSILDAGDVATDITATSAGAVTTLTAANGIGDDATVTDYGLELNVNSISATNSTGNNIDLTLSGNNILSGGIINSATGGGLIIGSTGSLTIDTGVATSDGIIDLSAGTSLMMNAGSTINAGDAAVTLTAVDNISLTSVTSTSNSATAIQVNSTSGSILDGDSFDDLDLITTLGGVSLAAADGIGDDASLTDYQLDINAASISVSNSTSNNISMALTGNVDLDGSLSNSATNGGLIIDASGSLTVSGGVTTNDGVVDLTAGTTLTMTDSGLINAGDNTVSLTAAGDIAVTSITSISNSATAVQVTSTGGAIVDGDTTDNIDITAASGTVVLNAANGIGDDGTVADNTLEITAANVSATNTTANGIDLSLVGNSTLAAIDNQVAAGTVAVTSSGSLGVNGLVTTNDGAITLDAATTLTMTDSGSINAGAETVTLTATGDIAITAITTTNSTAAAVQVTSSAGAIVDGDTADDVDITATSAGAIVSLNAANGIGDDGTLADNTLEISAASLSVSNTTANDIDLALTGNVDLDGSLSNSATNGGLIIDASGSLTVSGGVTTNDGVVDLTAGTTLTMTDSGLINAGDNTVSLTAAGDIAVTSITSISNSATAVQVTSTGGAIVDGDTTDNIDIAAASGTVVLNAANGIGDDGTVADNTLEITAANLSATNTTANGIDLSLVGNSTLAAMDNQVAAGTVAIASSGSLGVNGAVTTNDGAISLDAATTLTMTDTGSINAGTETVTLTATNDIAITDITTTNNTAAAVQVTSSAGAIVDGDTADNVDITATSAGAVVNLNAATGVGTVGNPLELDTTAVSVATTTGDVAFSNTGNLTVTGLTTTNGGVNVSAGGDLLVDTGGISTGGSANSITLNAGGGNLQIDGAVSTGSGTVTLLAAADMTINQTVSTSNTTIQADAGDDLTVTGSGAVSAGTGAVTLTADAGVGDTIGALSIASGGTVSGGNVALNSAETMSVTGVQGSSITLTSGADIVDSDSAAMDLTVTNPAASLTLNAAGAIGAGDALETDTRNLVLASGVAQTIDNTGDVTVSGITAHTGGDITVGTSGDLTLATSTISDASALALTAGGNVGISSLNSAGTVAVTSSTLGVGNVSVDSLTAAATTTVSSSLATTNSLTLNAVALEANASISSGGTLSTGAVTLAATGSHTLTSGGDMTLGTLTGSGSDLNLASASNMTVGTVTLGAGNFSAQVDTNADEVATLSTVAISAGTISLAGGADNNDQVLVGGLLSGGTISAINLGRLDLQRVQSSGTLTLAATDMRLSDNLVSGDTLLVDGGISLLNNVTMDSTNGGAASGSLVEIGGTLSGGGNNLTLNAGTHVACTDNAVLSGIGTFTVADSIKTVLGQTSVTTLNVRSSQEIHLNGTVNASSATFNADTNNDGVGIVSLLTGESINASSLTLVGVTAQVSASTPATCALPVGLPEMPALALIDPALLLVAAQESERFEETATDTFASNAPDVTYLDASCQPTRSGNKEQNNCELDESVRNFLGTFLIDFQLPGS